MFSVGIEPDEATYAAMLGVYARAQQWRSTPPSRFAPPPWLGDARPFDPREHAHSDDYHRVNNFDEPVRHKLMLYDIRGHLPPSLSLSLSPLSLLSSLLSALCLVRLVCWR